jgi:hypothetical protein
MMFGRLPEFFDTRRKKRRRNGLTFNSGDLLAIHRDSGITHPGFISQDGMV